MLVIWDKFYHVIYQNMQKWDQEIHFRNSFMYVLIYHMIKLISNDQHCIRWSFELVGQSAQNLFNISKMNFLVPFMYVSTYHMIKLIWNDQLVQQEKIHNSEGYLEFLNQPWGIPLADSKSLLEENLSSAGTLLEEFHLRTDGNVNKAPSNKFSGFGYTASAIHLFSPENNGEAHFFPVPLDV